MNKNQKRKIVERRKTDHEFILESFKEAIIIIGQRRTRDEREAQLLSKMQRSSGKILELIEQDKRELKELGL